MLRKILELTLCPMTDAELAEVLDLTTKDILVNRILFKQRTSLNYITEVVGVALGIIRRRK